jgi:hypothetical protein
MRIILKKQPLFGFFFIPFLTIIIISSFLCSLAYAMVIKDTHENGINILCPINILIVVSIILIIISIIINVYICSERYDKPYKLIV